MSRTAGTAELIDQMLACTPEPPAPDADDDPADVLVAATAILHDVAPLTAALRLASGGRPVAPEVEARLALLHARTQGWLAAAQRARQHTLDAMTQLSRARRRAAP